MPAPTRSNGQRSISRKLRKVPRRPGANARCNLPPRPGVQRLTEQDRVRQGTMAKAQATAGGGADAAERVAAMLRSHRGTLLRVARRWSATDEDAEDALQRAFEIYVRRLHRVDPAT